MIHPMQFKADYRLNISRNDLKEIEIGEKNINDELLDFVIVTIPEKPSEMTANLQGPVIINIKRKKGKQAITLNEDYSVKCNILDVMKDTYDNKGPEEQEKKEKVKKEKS